MKDDFIIIGAGVIGLSMAVRLLEEGASVSLLERTSVGSEASWAGGGILSPLCPWEYPESVTRLAMYSMACYPEWVAAVNAATGIDPEYHACGLLVLPPYDLAAATHWCSAHSVPFILQPAQQALLLAQVAQVRNPRLLQALHERVKQLNGTILEHCEVKQLRAANRRITTLWTSQGQLSASRYILTAGAWSRQVLGEFALNLKIKPIRGQMLLYKFPARPIQSIVLQKDLYLIPRRDGHVLIGSTTEDVGFNKQTTLAAKEKLSAWARNLLPDLDAMPLLKHWSGLRPAADNNVPSIGAHPRLSNLFINSGHFRYGVTMAPGSTEILLNEILERAQPFSTLPYQQGWNAHDEVFTSENQSQSNSNG